MRILFSVVLIPFFFISSSTLAHSFKVPKDVTELALTKISDEIYVAYGMLRGSIESPERKARFAAVYGIVAFVTVPLSWFAIRWWRTIHPDVLTSGEGMAMTSRMVHTLLASIATFTALYVTLLRQRIRLERAADALASLRLQAESKKGI